MGSRDNVKKAYVRRPWIHGVAGWLANRRPTFQRFQIGPIQACFESFKWSLVIGQLFTFLATFWAYGVCIFGWFSAIFHLSLKTMEDLAFGNLCIRFIMVFSLRAVGTTAFSKVGIYYSGHVDYLRHGLYPAFYI